MLNYAQNLTFAGRLASDDCDCAVVTTQIKQVVFSKEGLELRKTAYFDHKQRDLLVLEVVRNYVDLCRLGCYHIYKF